MSVDVNVGLVYDGAVIEINHQTGQYTVVSDDAPDDRLIKITKLNERTLSKAKMLCVSNTWPHLYKMNCRGTPPTYSCTLRVREKDYTSETTHTNFMEAQADAAQIFLSQLEEEERKIK